MIRLTRRVTGDIADEKISGEILLNFDERKRGRLKTTTTDGEDAGLFLERGRCLLDGEVLESDEGIAIRIRAAQESVVTAYARQPVQFARIAYHLGNRHVPLQIGDHWVRFQPDHVLEDLCRLYELEVVSEEAPFQPENGAYGEHPHGHGHGHGHSHDDSHDHHHH